MANDKLALWQERLGKNDSQYESERAQMDVRQALYQGSRRIMPLVGTARAENSDTPHVRNICSEMIESQVNSSLPAPKVTAVRPEDEPLAKIIEDMLRNEMDRLPFEQLNDMMERTVPIQGGAAYLVEWDNTERTHNTVGELTVSPIHPKQIVPQAGVYTGIEDMDYIILKMPQTREYIRRRYGVDVSAEGETEPDIKSTSEADTAEDMVTQYIAYYRNDSGGIGLYSWVGNTELEDLEDYQARRLRRCAVCGALEPMEDVQDVAEEVLDEAAAAVGAEDKDLTFGAGLPPDGEEWRGASMNWLEGELYAAPPDGEDRSTAKICPYCGAAEWVESTEDYEDIYFPIRRSDGSVIPGAQPVTVPTGELDEFGNPVITVTLEPTRIPYYKPNIYPVILQKNVSVYGQFLGDSDIDKIADQQNTTNRLEKKIIDKLVSLGSFASFPPEARMQRDENDMKVIYPKSPAEMSMIGVYTLQGDISQDLEYLEHVYEEARQIIGITDSFQGRKDSTATSGTAKEFAAAQSAGRLESKRVMRNAAYAALFEAMFKFKLAYADEPRPVISTDVQGETVYGTFNRYDFLRQDAAGDWYWNDQFLFSCDTSAPLANNREAMWQEARMNLQTGAFGDPTSLETLILFWTRMEQLHYPGAADTRTYLENQLQRQQQMQQVQMQMAARQAASQQASAAVQQAVQGASGGQMGGGVM